MQPIGLDNALDLDEQSLLLVPQQEKTNFLGRTWKWLTTNRSTLLKGAVATASVVSTVAISYFVAKEIAQPTANSLMHPLGIGAGITLPLLLGSTLPPAQGTALADWVSRWGFEILQAMTELYVRAGCPIVGKGFWNTSTPPMLATQLATFAFSTTATALTALSLRIFTAPVNEGSEERRATPLTLFLEGGSREHRRLLLEQLPKVALGLGSLALYRWEGSEEWLDFAYYILGHIGGTAVSKGYLWVKDRTIDKIESKPLKAIINKVGVTAELLCFGTFLAWSDDASYALSGAVAGAVKIAVLDKFQYLAKNDEEVRAISRTKVETAVKGIFLTLNFAWFISMVLDPALPRSQRVGIVSYLATSMLSYPLTRYLAANFSPEAQNNALFNSLRFYFVNFEEALLLPYMFIKDSGDVGIIGSNDQSQSMVKALIGLTSLGLAVGNNRALQGIRSHRSPNAVSDLALLISWFILYRQWLD